MEVDRHDWVVVSDDPVSVVLVDGDMMTRYAGVLERCV